MQNFIQPGTSLTVTAPADVSSGAGVKVGSLFGVAAGDALTGAEVEISPRGVYELPVLGTDDVGVGDKLYWDDGNSRLTLTASTHLLVGVATAVSGVGITTVNCYLTGAFTV